jgi:DNA replication protein DnaC
VRHLGEVSRALLCESERISAARAARIATEVMPGEQLASYVARSHGEAFASLLPAGLPLPEFLSGSSDDAVMAATERMRLCVVCRGAPARCAGRDDQLLRPGLRPVWQGGGLEAESCRLYAEHRIRWKLERCGVPVAMLDASLESYEPTSKLQRGSLALCRRYVEEFAALERHRRGLQIYGPATGIGKTHLAVGVLRALVTDSIVERPLFVFVPEFLDRIRQSFDDKTGKTGRMMERVRQADLLVLDDLGAERTSEWVQEQLTIILNARWSHGLSTIITTNASLEELRASLGDRAQSRLKGSLAERVIVDGEDRRQ